MGILTKGEYTVTDLEDGKDAKLLYLTASSQVQAFDKDNKPKTTQAITISAKLQNASGTATFVAIPYIGNIAQTAITLGGTGNNRTLLPSQWTNTQWTTISITATLGSLTDTISVVRVKDGDTGATGKDGVAGKDGVGLKSTTIQYAQSTSGTTAPTTGWATNVPTLVKGQYLWTKTVWTYTDNSSETGYTVSYNAKDGNNGTDGIAGKDGVGIASTKVEYVGSSSGTVKPTTGWSTTIPTVAEGSFLWTKTTWTYTDSTTEVGYSVSKMGAKGAKGDQGIQGPQGPNGQTYYTWLKYADTPTTGMSDSPTNKKYMGLAYNKTTATESTNYADYTWSLIQGPQGNQGIQGPAGANGQPTYTWIKYGTSASGAGMSDNPTGKTYIGIAYNKTTATESTNAADYTWSLIQGPKGDTGPQGPQGAQGPKGDRGVMGVAYMQPTQPSDTTEGATWFKTESTTSDKIIGVYTYKGGWQEKKYASATLAVEDLSALSANLGNVTAGNITGVTINGTTITGSEIVNEFDFLKGFDYYLRGDTTIKDAGIVINAESYQGGNVFYNQRLEYSANVGGLYVQETSPTSQLGERWVLMTPTGIGMYDGKYASTYGQVNLKYQDLMSLPTVGIPADSGWTQYSTSGINLPTATRNGRVVQLAGAFKNVNVLPKETTSVMGILPVGYRPKMNVNTLVQGSMGHIYLLTVRTNGQLNAERYRRGYDYVAAVAGTWFNIACTYAAADI